MSVPTQSDRDYPFAIGLLAGAVAGAGLMMLFTPATGADLRRRVKNSARTLSNHASATYQDVSDQVGGAIDKLSSKGQRICDDVADAVAHGAHEVERFATGRKARVGSRQL